MPTKGAGFPVLLIHGFASTKEVNWINTGWFKALNAAGFGQSRLTIADTAPAPSSTPKPIIHSPEWPATRWRCSTI